MSAQEMWSFCFLAVYKTNVKKLQQTFSDSQQGKTSAHSEQMRHRHLQLCPAQYVEFSSCDMSYASLLTSRQRGTLRLFKSHFPAEDHLPVRNTLVSLTLNIC